MKVKPPEPGIYDVPFDEYAEWDAINSGALKWGGLSPKHMHAFLKGDIETDDTADMKFGRAAHCGILEPEVFAAEYAVATPCCAILKSGDNKGNTCGKSPKCRSIDGEWFCGTHKPTEEDTPAEFVSADEMGRIEAIRESIKSSPANDLVRRPSWSEKSVVWDWRGDLMIKGRLDRIAQDHSFIIDMKTCGRGAGDYGSCQRAIEKHEWHIQAAVYIEGVYELTGVKPDFMWLFVEKVPPFDVNVIPIDPESFAIGRWEMERRLVEYRRCLKDGKFPGYIRDSRGVHRGGVTQWKRREYQGIELGDHA